MEKLRKGVRTLLPYGKTASGGLRDDDLCTILCTVAPELSRFLRLTLFLRYVGKSISYGVLVGRKSSSGSTPAASTISDSLITPRLSSAPQ